VKLVLKGIWAIPVIASILILGSLGLIQEADAATRTFTTDTTITSNENIAPGETWTINSGVTLTIDAGVTIEVFSTATIFINSGGTIDNFGSIRTIGTINNLGTFNNFGTLENQGTINNQGIFNNFGTLNITNIGTINNFGGTIILIDNGFIIGEGNIINDFFGTIIGTSCGSGTTRSESTNECEADVTQAQLDAALAELVTLQGLLDQALLDLGDALFDLAAALLTITGLETLVEELGQPGPPIANQGNGQGVPAQGKNKP